MLALDSLTCVALVVGSRSRFETIRRSQVVTLSKTKVTLEIMCGSLVPNNEYLIFFIVGLGMNFYVVFTCMWCVFYTTFFLPQNRLTIISS